MPRLFGNFLQNAYVTSDMDRAKAVFAEDYGVSKFADIDNCFEVKTPAGVGELDLKIALAFIDDLQIELIQPMGGSAVGLYSDILPDDEFAIRFHHSCFVIPGPKQAWSDFRKIVDQRGMTVAVEADLGIVQFCYLDTRKTTGHYSEYIWSSEDIQAQVPRN